MNKLHALYRYARLKLNNALCRVMFSGKQPAKKHFLSVCAIFKNEGRFLKEWLDYYLLAGVDHFYLYDNGSDDDGVAVLKRYNKFPSVSFYWKMFGSNGIVADDPEKLVTEQFTLCWDFNSYKSVLNTKFDKWISKKSRSPHFWRFKFFDRVCPKNPAYYAGLTEKQIRPNVQLNHYYGKSFDYFRNKKQIGRQLDDKQKLTLSVFFDNEHRAVNADYQIFKYLIELKMFDLEARGKILK